MWTQKVMQLYYSPSDITNPDNPYYRKEDEEEGRVEFKNVSFAYESTDEGKNIIDTLNLNIEAGKTLALVGPSGGGKSTIADLIPRFYDVTSGEILVDGVNIKQYDVASLRESMGIVTQETVLFNDSIENNWQGLVYDNTAEKYDKWKAARQVTTKPEAKKSRPLYTFSSGGFDF